MNKERDRKVIELYLAGMTYRSIAENVGLSRARISQIIRPPKPIYKLVRNRAEGKCEQCGTELEKGHVHHVNSKERSIEDFNDIGNLQYLCQPCHREAHNGVPLMNSYTRSPKSQSVRCADYGHPDCKFVAIRFEGQRRTCPAMVLAWTALKRHQRKEHKVCPVCHDADCQIYNERRPLTEMTEHIQAHAKLEVVR